MAWVVIGAGALLFAGGATALLLGFDIVMTERGMAMSIAGTVALAGGVVAIALGLVLQTLRKLLKALESRGRPAMGYEGSRPAQPDRPVVPIVTEPASSTSSGLLGGAVLGAGALGAGAALAGGMRADPEALAEDSASTPPIATPAEFEAELQKALNDTPDTAAEASSDADRGAEEQPVRDDAEPAGDAVESLHADAPETALEAILPESSLLEDPLPDMPAQEPAAMDGDGEGAEATERNEEPEPEDSSLANPPEDFEPRKPIAGDVADDPVDAEQGAPQSEDAEADGATVAAPPPEEPAKPKPPVLGSYKAGGRTYTMYADGSVEAITDDGVERFASLEALRKHLAEVTH